MADRQRLVQVLNNLLANAARHAPASAPIRIAAEREGLDVAVSVADEGQGIAPDQLGQLFRKYTTAGDRKGGPRDPVEGRGHRQVAPVEGKTANTPRLGPVSTSRQRIAELARQALGMAVAIAWFPGPAGTRRRVAKLSVEEPDAAEPARPDLWGARVSNDPGLPDRRAVRRAPPKRPTSR